MPAFLSFMAFCAGIIVARSVPAGLFLFYRWGLGLAIVFFTSLTLFIPRRFVRVIAMALCGFAVMLHSLVSQYDFFSIIARNLLPEKAVYHGSVASSQSFKNGRYHFIVNVDSAFFGPAGATGYRLHKKFWCHSFDPAEMSTRISFCARYTKPRIAVNPGDFDEYTLLISQNLWGHLYCDSLAILPGTVSPIDRAMNSLRALIIRTINHAGKQDNRSLLLAGFLGERTGLSDEVHAVYYNAGIYHLLALSGFNVELLAVSIFFILGMLPVSRKIKICIVLVAIWGYLVLVGPIPSLYRATVMSTLFLAGYIFDRRNLSVNALGVAGLGWLLISPDSLVTPGFQLSFCATFGIIAFYPGFAKLVRFGKFSNPLGQMGTWFAKMVWGLFSISLISFFSTLPVLIYHFKAITLFGLLANLVAVPLMSIALWALGAAIIIQAIYPALVFLPMIICENTLDLIFNIANMYQLLPVNVVKFQAIGLQSISLITLLMIYLATAEYRARPMRHVIIIMLLLTLMVYSFLPQNNRLPLASITFLSTQQNGLILLQCPENKMWVFNGEGDPHSTGQALEYSVTPVLTALGIQKIDRLFIPSLSIGNFIPVKTFCDRYKVDHLSLFSTDTSKLQTGIIGSTEISKLFSQPLEIFFNKTHVTCKSEIVSRSSNVAGIQILLQQYKVSLFDKATGKNMDSTRTWIHSVYKDDSPPNFIGNTNSQESGTKINTKTSGVIQLDIFQINDSLEIKIRPFK